MHVHIAGKTISWTPESFIANSGWRFARTMPKHPHEYTVRDLMHPERSTCQSAAAFERFVEHIRTDGFKRPWFGRTYVCLRVGAHEYWTMGYPVAETTIINRKVIGAPD